MDRQLNYWWDKSPPRASPALAPVTQPITPPVTPPATLATVGFPCSKHLSIVEIKNRISGFLS
jgi:hypothetical protein